MKLNLIQRKNESVDKEELNIILEFTEKTSEIEDLINYINNYRRKVVVNKGYDLIEIDYKDIILFYSYKKNRYCKTHEGTYQIKSKLYELERIDLDFIRISKSCIINIKHVEKFDLSETGRITVKLNNKMEEIVSRRKRKDVMEFLEERGI